MYFTMYHTYCVFAAVTLFIFGSFLIYYYSKKKENFFTYSLILFASISIGTYSILMTLDSNLKSTELRNINYYKSANYLVVLGNIYNNGEYPVELCNLSFRILNDSKINVDGSIFATDRKTDSQILEKPRNSYAYDFVAKGVIYPKTYKSFRYSFVFPKHFKEFKLRTNVECR